MKTNTIVLEVLSDEAQKRREPGYYWVRRLGESLLQVAQWDGEVWMLPGSSITLCDDSFSVISVDPVRA